MDVTKFITTVLPKSIAMALPIYSAGRCRKFGAMRWQRVTEAI